MVRYVGGVLTGGVVQTLRKFLYTVASQLALYPCRAWVSLVPRPYQPQASEILKAICAGISRVWERD